MRPLSKSTPAFIWRSACPLSPLADLLMETIGCRRLQVRMQSRTLCSRDRLPLKLHTPRLGFHKDRPRFGQPDRTETVGPPKWAFDGLGRDSVRSTEILSPGPNEKKKNSVSADQISTGTILVRRHEPLLPKRFLRITLSFVSMTTSLHISTPAPFAKKTWFPYPPILHPAPSFLFLGVSVSPIQIHESPASNFLISAMSPTLKMNERLSTIVTSEKQSDVSFFFPDRLATTSEIPELDHSSLTGRSAVRSRRHEDIPSPSPIQMCDRKCGILICTVDLLLLDLRCRLQTPADQVKG